MEIVKTLKTFKPLSALVAVGLALAPGCTGTLEVALPFDDTSWSLTTNADQALVDIQHADFGSYPNPRKVTSMQISLDNDGRICADDGEQQWCGGPVQGIPYVTVLAVKQDRYCVRVVDIYGNDVRQGCRAGAPPEAYASVIPDVSAPDNSGGKTDGVAVGTKLVIDAINAGLAKVGLKTRVAMPQAKALADFDQGEITMGQGACQDVADYLDDEFSDDHPGTDDYVYGKEAISDCLDQGRCRIGQLVTRAMASACSAIPAGVVTYQAEIGVVGGGGHAVGVLCSGDNKEIPKCVGSPLVLDLAGDGLQLQGPGAVRFPLVGTRRVRTGWLAGSDDALLALDLNGDGKITSARELFGEVSGGFAPDGFAALARLDENGDGAISAADPAFGRLLAWRDDGDGVSEPGELLPLARVGIRSISLRRTRSDQEDAHGNLLGLRGEARGRKGARIPVVDVWFRFEAPAR